MPSPDTLPSVVLICHQQDRLDADGLAGWLASTMRLAGLVVVSDGPSRFWKAARHERRRSGAVGLADALMFRLYSRLLLRRRDEQWKARELARLRQAYPADLSAVPRLAVTTPNSEESKRFLAALTPDLIIARCKHLLRPDVFGLARVGTFALHPGICPEYRNAHGCFWALVERDLGRVGMTLLKIDAGVDTGPIYFQGGCPVDELRDSHTMIQYRAVFANLDPIGRTLLSLCRDGQAEPVSTAGRRSAVWGHPRLSRYLKWKWTVRRNLRNASHSLVVS
jgi:hypothetical protein